jgi:polysaccharide chain length determinant protein (PEP-CTERM system associated)
MDETSQPIKIGYYLDVISRRRWFIILPFCLVMVTGIYLAITLPKIYSAETLILLQPQGVSEDYVRPVVSAGIESRINTISQQIMSRSNLEKIISQFNLFMTPEHEGMPMEAKVESLRRRIMVEVIRHRRSPADAFSISFKGKDPEMVMHITNALAMHYIDENLKLIEDQAVGTSDFIEHELSATREELEQLEEKLKIYRETHMGGLPEQLEANLRILDRLQAQLNNKQENLRDAKNRLISLNNQLTEIQTMQQSVVVPSSTDSDEVETDPYLKLQRMKLELEDLNSRYTARHPDVIRLNKMIEDLERKIQEESVRSSDTSQYKTSMQILNPGLAERKSLLEQQRVETDLEIKDLKIENVKLLNQIAYYQRLVEATPKREQELLLLQRDYNNIKKNYNSLLERKTQANLAVNLEKGKKGEQFRVLDRAHLPIKPSEPDMKKFFLLTLAAAIGLGGGLVFVLEYFDTSVRQVKDLEFDLDLSVLATIPKIYNLKDKLKYRLYSTLTVVSIVFAMALTAGLAVLVLKGVEPTMEVVNQIIAFRL